MPKAQQVNIHIVTQPDEELEFYVKDNLLGKELFDLVCRAIGLRESYYFGLHYERPGKPAQWLRMDKKIRSELGSDIKTVKLYLRVEFYPEDVETGLILRLSQHLFFLHVKSEILTENIYCPAEEAVLMASYAVQAKVTNMYQLTDEQWEERIVAWYAEHCFGLSRSEAEFEYLRIAQDLEMHGMGYYRIQNENGTNLWLGIHASGINIYEEENKLIPKVSFVWSEIENISFKNTHIWILPMEKEAKRFNFISKDVCINREILLLCSGNHDLYMKRRRPDSLEIQIMKSQAKEIVEERQRERKRFLKEHKAHMAALQMKIEIENRLQEYQSTLQSYRVHLQKAEETTDLLAEKALVAEEESRLLIKKAAELESEVKRMHMIMSKKDEEVVYLESHIQSADIKVQQILQESELRSHESMLLKQQLDQSRKSEKIATEKLFQLTNSQYIIPQPIILNGVVDTLDEAKIFHKERVDYLEKSHHLQRQLTELKSEIEGLKVNGSQDLLDRIHLENVGNGETKYSTMQKLQAASTNARIQVYQKL